MTARGATLRPLPFWSRLILVAAFSCLIATGGLAVDRPASILARWYSALERVDRAAIGDLLADEATIRLDDLGIVQSKAEFVDALDAWADAIAGGSIAWRLDPDAVSAGNDATAFVCYRFPGQPVLARETFTFDGAGRIAASRQETIEGPCIGF